MEELIFFGIIILFSILDSIAKSRKKKGGRPEAIPEPTWQGSEGWDEPEPSEYDEEPSYEEHHVAGQALGLYRTPEPVAERAVATVVPADVWAELEALARGQVPAEPEPLEVPARRVESIPARPDHRVHTSHAEYGTDPSSRRKSAQDDLDPLRETLSDDARKARRLLRATDAHSLRQAIILQEILSTPVSLRDE